MRVACRGSFLAPDTKRMDGTFLKTTLTFKNKCRWNPPQPLRANVTSEMYGRCETFPPPSHILVFILRHDGTRDENIPVPGEVVVSGMNVPAPNPAPRRRQEGIFFPSTTFGHRPKCQKLRPVVTSNLYRRWFKPERCCSMLAHNKRKSPIKFAPSSSAFFSPQTTCHPS